MSDKHKLEISTDENGQGKLIIDGHDLSNFAHEIRIVLTAGKTPQVQVDLYGIDGLGAKLEDAGLVLNVHKPGEPEGVDFSYFMEAAAREGSRLGIPPRDLLQYAAKYGEQTVSGHVTGMVHKGGPFGMSDPRS